MKRKKGMKVFLPQGKMIKVLVIIFFVITV